MLKLWIFLATKHTHTQKKLKLLKSIKYGNLCAKFIGNLFTLFVLLYGVAKASYTIWLRPKWLERNLKQQGVRGTPYKPLVGDMKEFVRLITEAWSKPLSLTHQIVPRVDPLTLTTVRKYGKHNFVLPPNFD